MDIEQKLEALTHSVELLAGMQIETEKRMTQLVEQSTRLQDAIATMAEGMAQITRVVLDHDRRIDDLEGNQTQR